MLFCTGSSRESTSILKHQRKSTQEQDGAVLTALHHIKQLAAQIQVSLGRGDLEEFARLLHASSQEKRRLAPGLSTGWSDTAYAPAPEKGAVRRKITAAFAPSFPPPSAHTHTPQPPPRALP